MGGGLLNNDGLLVAGRLVFLGLLVLFVLMLFYLLRRENNG